MISSASHGARRRNYRKVTVIPPSLVATARAMKRRGELPSYVVICRVPRRFTWGPWCAPRPRDYDGTPITYGEPST